MSHKCDVIDYRCQINTFECINNSHTPTTLENKEIMHKNKSDLCSVGIQIKHDKADLLDIYMPQLSLKQCYITESSNCSTKPLSKWLAFILSTVKTWFQRYFDTNTSCYKGGWNQTSILENARDLVEFINQVCGSSRPKILNRIATIG